ncbi:MAG: DNA-protecting protein DprA [Chlamydiae bacterium]|nr:DNA-protecting protein DprA [Chlamydiota bacterium]MBI3277276.1 DNA-protecting protein DprA [Chlamydiota bacterium]
MTEKEALILLNMTPGVGPVSLRKVKAFFPNVVDVFGAKAETLSQNLELRLDIASRILEAPQKIDWKKELDFIFQEKIQVMSLWESDYPSLLSQIYDPPPLLYLKGKNPFKGVLSIALVGARSSTLYGNQTAYRLAFQLASYQFAVVSGLARGIDTHAHQGALAAKGVTVGVMGCGMRHFYPQENRFLSDSILERGCVVTEFPSEVPPLGANFPKRNRMISGLSLGVVVVEAARRSGSLITASLALEQGRSVFAVPGRIDIPSASGTLGLIKEGAKLVQSVEDILEELGIEITVEKDETLIEASLTEEEKSILRGLNSEPVSVDELARHVKFETSRLLSLLFGLELRHFVKQLPGKYYIKNSPQSTVHRLQK